WGGTGGLHHPRLALCVCVCVCVCGVPPPPNATCAPQGPRQRGAVRLGHRRGGRRGHCPPDPLHPHPGFLLRQRHPHPARLGDAALGHHPGRARARDLHCLLVTNPHKDAWKSQGLAEVASYCAESRDRNQWVPYVCLQER
uniref:Uncharacterized protein n=1 Tax=Calidris pygmaea TaxID=425635 RepID=A0A8C3K951_9CHAR